MRYLILVLIAPLLVVGCQSWEIQEHYAPASQPGSPPVYDRTVAYHGGMFDGRGPTDSLDKQKPLQDDKRGFTGGGTQGGLIAAATDAAAELWHKVVRWAWILGITGAILLIVTFALPVVFPSIPIFATLAAGIKAIWGIVWAIPLGIIHWWQARQAQKALTQVVVGNEAAMAGMTDEQKAAFLDAQRAAHRDKATDSLVAAAKIS